MNKLLENKFSILAGGVILGGLLMSRGGLYALVPLIRFLLPVIVVLLVFRFVKKKLAATAGEAFKRQMGQMGRQGPGGEQQRVIDLCPKCGSYMAPGHRCKS